MSITLSLAEARRLAVASQGFGPKPATASVAHVRKLAARLQAIQIDSVNVLVVDSRSGLDASARGVSRRRRAGP